jgi:hypothetical protein
MFTEGGKVSSFRSPPLFYLPVHSRCGGFLFSRDHTQTHITVGRIPLDEGSARRRDLYLTTQTLTKEKKIHAPGGIRTHDPSKRSAADLRLRGGKDVNKIRVLSVDAGINNYGLASNHCWPFFLSPGFLHYLITSVGLWYIYIHTRTRL